MKKYFMRSDEKLVNFKFIVLSLNGFLIYEVMKLIDKEQ